MSSRSVIGKLLKWAGWRLAAARSGGLAGFLAPIGVRLRASDRVLGRHLVLASDLFSWRGSC